VTRAATATGRAAVAAFDFDGTMTRRDSIVPFLRAVVGRKTLLVGLARALPSLATHALGRTGNEALKERLFTRFLSGMPESELRFRATAFAEEQLPALLSPPALARLGWHLAQGHRCILVTASPEVYVEPWARRAGFEHVLASRLEVGPDGRITGRFAGVHCDGAEKVRRLQEVLPARAEYVLYAYGDGPGDHELLAAADHAYYRLMSDDAA
jgi:HAD superfamily hydrolase (TIGR01490 family)